MATEVDEMLEAVGFAPAQARRYQELAQKGRTEDCIRLLRCRRCALMDALHEAQRPIDIIDWTIHSLQKGEGIQPCPSEWID